MNPEYALTQLLKLDPLTFDEIKLYTGWTDEKTNSAIEKCKASGEIQRKCSKNQFGYKWAVRTMPDTQGSPVIQRIQPTVHHVWGVRNKSAATAGYRAYSKDGEAKGLVDWIR